jgi:hypothetical protein
MTNNPTDEDLSIVGSSPATGAFYNDIIEFKLSGLDFSILRDRIKNIIVLKQPHKG